MCLTMTIVMCSVPCSDGEFVTSFGGHCGDDKGKKYKGPFRICCDIHEQRFVYMFDLLSAHNVF